MHFRGLEISGEGFSLIQDVVSSGGEHTRMQLALKICELLEWRRPSGKLKGHESYYLLEELERQGQLVLPEKRRTGRPKGSRTAIPMTMDGVPGEELVGNLGEFTPVEVVLVRNRADNYTFRELIGRYHPLGYKVPFGAQLRYLVYVQRPKRVIVGAVQFSSPAWRVAVRDRWIGWSDERRQNKLQQIVNNSRFLILPWVRVKNLASSVLSQSTRRLQSDWQARYGVEPLLAETLVDTSQYRGICYLAANWTLLGSTTGRGRMDRTHARHGAAPKNMLVYPLVKDAVKRLREGL